MKGKSIVSIIDMIFQWIVRLVVVNFLWILFTLIGLVIGGIFPATTAALGVCRKWLLSENDVSIWKTYNEVYRREFFTSNLLGWFLTAVGGILYVNYRLLSETSGEMWVGVTFAYYLLVFFYAVVVLWSFPLLVHYKTRWFQHFKNAFIIGIAKMHYTLMLAIVLSICIYYSLEYPGLMPFFSVSVAAFGMMWVALKWFKNMDERNESE